jgi:hypothetical protein
MKIKALIIVLNLVSCTGLQTVGGGAIDFSRTEELLIAGYSMEEISKAKTGGYFANLVNEARASGKVEKGYQEWLAGFEKPEYEKYVKQQDFIKHQQIMEQRKREQELKRKRQEQEQQKFQAFVDNKKYICRTYGFTEENAIAKCVQEEINNEINRLQQQRAYANAQANANAQARYNAFSNYGRCLSTAGETFASCANAWQGYTPPTKTVTKCRYDTFGNVINGTCTSRTQ